MENEAENSIQENNHVENEGQEPLLVELPQEIQNHYNGDLLVALPEKRRGWNLQPYRGKRKKRKNYKTKSYDYEKIKQRIYKKSECPYCDKTYNIVTSAYNHIQMKHRGFPVKYEGGPIQCTICRETCDDTISLTEHVMTHPPGMMPKKRTYNKSDGDRDPIYRHQGIRVESSDQSFIDTGSQQYDGPGLRPKAIVDYDLGDEEMENPKKYLKRTKPLRYECPACHKKFKSKDYVKIHAMKHCPLSNAEGGAVESFSTVQVKQEVIEETTFDPVGEKKKRGRKKKEYVEEPTFTNKPSIFQCSICTRMFKTYALCQKHIASHRKLKKHPCPTCFMTFTSEELLEQHMDDVHREMEVVVKQENDIFVIDEDTASENEILPPRTYECLLCSGTFKHEDDLKSHARTHSFQDQAAFLTGK
ncbi:hypothetical protein DMENIID0001_103880 [Sergentomyia squamirostris]